MKLAKKIALFTIVVTVPALSSPASAQKSQQTWRRASAGLTSSSACRRRKPSKPSATRWTSSVRASYIEAYFDKSWPLPDVEKVK
jgi:hypothetical protein